RTRDARAIDDSDLLPSRFHAIAPLRRAPRRDGWSRAHGNRRARRAPAGNRINVGLGPHTIVAATGPGARGSSLCVFAIFARNCARSEAPTVVETAAGRTGSADPQPEALPGVAELGEGRLAHLVDLRGIGARGDGLLDAREGGHAAIPAQQ